MNFDVVGQIVKIETIAVGHGIGEWQNLKPLFGDANWRKLKGEASIKFHSGHARRAEQHWYEAHGIGRRKLKIKRFLDKPMNPPFLH